MDDITRAYVAIFDLVSETCMIEKVRRTGTGKNESGDKTYSYDAIVAAPVALPDMEADEKTCTEVRKFAKKELKKLGGPDVIQTLVYKKKNGEQAKFNFACNLIPDNIMSLEIKDGVLRVTCKAYGTFF